MVPVSSPGSLTVPEMLASIKATTISKCRPVRKVQPPSENMCLVGQSSGRIKWIQPSGRALPLPQSASLISFVSMRSFMTGMADACGL